MSPVQLLLKPSTWVKFVCFFFFLFSRGFCHLGPRTPQNPWKNKKNNPMSPVQLLLRPSPWVNFFCVFLFSRGFCHLGPKTHQNQWKKQKESTRVTCPASPQTLSMGRNCFFLLLWFLEVFATVSVQQYQLLIFFVFFVFLPLGFLRKIFTLTYIHWQSFHPSTFHIDFFIELLILATEPSEKIYRKNGSITHLFRHSIGLMFFWYAKVLVPHL